MNILILTNNFNCIVIQELRKNIFIDVEASYTLSDIKKRYDVVFAHNYDKIIPEEYFSIPKLGIFILHSSDLPKGRGWAPIYHTIANKDDLYTISLLKASKEVDEGNIFFKLKINKPILIMNRNLREIDEDGVILLINKYIDLYRAGYITDKTEGKKQNSENATYNKRRTPEDNLLDKKESIDKSIYKILASNSDYPAFIEIYGERLYFNITTEKYYSLDKLKYNIQIMI